MSEQSYSGSTQEYPDFYSPETLGELFLGDHELAQRVAERVESANSNKGVIVIASIYESELWRDVRSFGSDHPDVLPQFSDGILCSFEDPMVRGLRATAHASEKRDHRYVDHVAVDFMSAQAGNHGDFHFYPHQSVGGEELNLIDSQSGLTRVYLGARSTDGTTVIHRPIPDSDLIPFRSDSANKYAITRYVLIPHEPSGDFTSLSAT